MLVPRSDLVEGALPIGVEGPLPMGVEGPLPMGVEGNSNKQIDVFPPNIFVLFFWSGLKCVDVIGILVCFLIVAILYGLQEKCFFLNVIHSVSAFLYKLPETERRVWGGGSCSLALNVNLPWCNKISKIHHEIFYGKQLVGCVEPTVFVYFMYMQCLPR